MSTASEYGLLRGPGTGFRLDRFPPGANLAPLVERHWLVSWELPEGRTGSATLLPHPCVNLVLDRGRLGIAGVGLERFTYSFRSQGRVFGTKFRPGGFRGCLSAPVSSLTGRLLPAEQLWGPSAVALAASLTGPVENLIAQVEEFLRARMPAPDPNVELVGQIVAALLFDRTITRVDDVTARFGVAPRTLQRLFARYVGVSPKWVLRRYRLHEAAARLAEGHDRPWAEVAAELGYFDQPHFIRDFTAAVGLTPVAYAQLCRREQAPVRA
ncbi:helix-turn-helix domain-containing protein [Pseudonocardia asaccharolytica]|uniref:AraC family transcriptional regulator n=1 Tax=Pseudonocardia asaccharolytica DSM 44247 = NBRC 16224 TaxID=1123024 RepID=A0A511CV66_9PSEU|nr:helix-turn-helix domain-containing protein [Pseudonocardia asaccharolytica]GEL16337.1 AraC family transcriptional regulator [Pseudonocardia asaccharolytica DSM 44247 = NBRC 16224]